VPAGAGANGIRVVDGESGPHEAVDVVDFGASNVGGAEVVDHDSDAVLLDDLVTSPGGVVEGHSVLEPGAASSAYEDAKRNLWVPFLLQQRPELRQGFAGE